MRRWFVSFYPEMNPDEQRAHRSVSWFLTTFSLVLLFILISAILIAASNAHGHWSTPNFITFLGLGLLTGATGFAGGGFIGFLFGVPRVLAEKNGAGNGVASNTNLEQVSDWLTKMIVGVSLVEFNALNEALLQFSAQVDAALVSGMPSGATAVRGAGFATDLILVGSAIAGFLAAYLKSKTDLMSAFAPKEEMQFSLGKVIADQIIGEIGRQVLDRPSTDPDQCAKDMAAKLIQFVRPDSRDPDLHRMLGLAQAILKNFRAASDALAKAVELASKGGATPDASLVALATRALAISGNSDAARDLAAQSSNNSSVGATGERELANMFAQLYARGGYDTAIEIGEKLAQDSEMRKSGRLWLYLASGYGQRHANLLLSSATSQELADAREKALNAVKEALKLDRPANYPVLRMLWDKHASAKPENERDLEDFFEDPEFRELLA